MLVAGIFAELGLEKRLDRTNVSGDINGELTMVFICLLADSQRQQKQWQCLTLEWFSLGSQNWSTSH